MTCAKCVPRTILNCFILITLLAPQKSHAYDFSYSGRLVEADGKPLPGPVALKIRFFHSETASASVLDITSGIDNVTLRDGVFQVVLSLDPSDFQNVFPSVSQPVYIEVTDLTNAPGSPYGRQQLTLLPYAGKIPVDADKFSWNSQGQLTLKSSASDATSVTAESTSTLTNKTIDAASNTVTNIANTNISATAAITDSKLATISTAGKVSGAAITSGTIAGSTSVSTTGDIATTGKVGIGAAAGTSKLEITGSGATSASSALNVLNSTPTSLLYVRNDGNVGIGTTAPTHRLEVRKDVIGAGDRANASVLIEAGSGGLADAEASIRLKPKGNWGSSLEYGYSGGVAGNSLNIYNHKDAEVEMLIDDVGRVGIGTITPVATLELKSQLAAADFQTTKSGGGWGGWVQRTFRDHAWGPQLVTYHARGTETSPLAVNLGDYLFNIDAYGHDGTQMGHGASLNFMATEAWTATSHPSSVVFTTTPSNSTTAVDRVTIASSGNVGIGETAPQALLHVGTSSGNILIGSNFGSAGETSAGALNFINTSSGTWELAKIEVSGSQTAGNAGILKFKTGSATSTAVERMRINDVGNVGIGTTSPTLALQIDGINGFPATSGATQTAGSFRVGNTVSQRVLDFGIDGGSSTAWIQSTTKNNLANGNVLAINPNGGNVGIGTPTPGYKLTVNGEPAANGYTSFTNYSDRRLKRDIRLIDDGALAKIMALRPTTFHYNDLTGYDEETKGRKMRGFIAQELREVFPEMVHTTKIDGKDYLDTNLSYLQVYLVKAVQELKRLVDGIVKHNDQRVSNLEAENRLLKMQLGDIRSHLCSKDPNAEFCEH